MKYLAIDYGTKRTGLATCDASETITSPLAVIESPKKLTQKIAGVVEQEQIEAIVIGLPLNMDGSKGPQAELVLKFVENLKKQLDIAIYLQDERLSSFAAEQKLAPADLTTKKQKKRIDAVAAAQILEDFLEAKKH